VKSELDGLQALASQGMVEKTKIRATERDLTRLKGERDELASKVASANTAISEKELKKFQVKKPSTRRWWPSSRRCRPRTSS
jgi:hypothetical protein